MVTEGVREELETWTMVDSPTWFVQLGFPGLCPLMDPMPTVECSSVVI